MAHHPWSLVALPLLRHPGACGWAPWQGAAVRPPRRLPWRPARRRAGQRWRAGARAWRIKFGGMLTQSTPLIFNSKVCQCYLQNLETSANQYPIQPTSPTHPPPFRTVALQPHLLLSAASDVVPVAALGPFAFPARQPWLSQLLPGPGIPTHRRVMGWKHRGPTQLDGVSGWKVGSWYGLMLLKSQLLHQLLSLQFFLFGFMCSTLSKDPEGLLVASSAFLKMEAVRCGGSKDINGGL